MAAGLDYSSWSAQPAGRRLYTYYLWAACQPAVAVLLYYLLPSFVSPADCVPKLLVAAVGRMAELVGSQMGSVDDDYRPVPQYAPGSQKRG